MKLSHHIKRLETPFFFRKNTQVVVKSKGSAIRWNSGKSCGWWNITYNLARFTEKIPWNLNKLVNHDWPGGMYPTLVGHHLKNKPILTDWDVLEKGTQVLMLKTVLNSLGFYGGIFFLGELKSSLSNFETQKIPRCAGPYMDYFFFDMTGETWPHFKGNAGRRNIPLEHFGWFKQNHWKWWFPIIIPVTMTTFWAESSPSKIWKPLPRKTI